MNAVELVTTLQRQGFTFIPLPGGKLAVKPADRITDDLRQQIRQCKGEVLALLEPVTWLQSKLVTPQRIALLIAEWVGTLETPTGHSLDALMQARWTLGVIAYFEENGRAMWQLPRETVQ
jgi:hypothetical protein